MKNYIPCTKCGKKAIWSYMPGSENYCDNCVPRGCSCTSGLKDGIAYDSEEAKDPANYVWKIDELGRKVPCCEFSIIYDESHNDKDLIRHGYGAYYESHPEKRHESEEIEHWEHKLGEDK